MESAPALWQSGPGVWCIIMALSSEGHVQVSHVQVCFATCGGRGIEAWSVARCPAGRKAARRREADRPPTRVDRGESWRRVSGPGGEGAVAKEGGGCCDYRAQTWAAYDHERQSSWNGGRKARMFMCCLLQRKRQPLWWPAVARAAVAVAARL